MITGRQLREALALVGMHPLEIAARAAIGPVPVLEGLAKGVVRLSRGDETRLRAAFGEAGVIILPEHRGDLGVRKLPGAAPRPEGKRGRATSRRPGPPSHRVG